MRNSLVALGLLLLTSALTAGPSLRFEDLPSARTDAALPWTAPGNNSWKTIPALFTLTDTSHPDLTVQGRLAATSEALLIRLEVLGQVKRNKQKELSLWWGDLVQVSFDSRGTGSPAPDDLSAGFALTNLSSDGITFTSPFPDQSGDYPKELRTITRDDGKKLTVYDLKFPWNRIGTGPGTFPRLGLAIMVRVTDQDGTGVVFRWGGAPEPYKFLSWDQAPPPAPAVVALNRSVWAPGDEARFLVIAGGPVAETLKVTDGILSDTWTIPAGQRLRKVIRYIPGAWKPGTPPVLNLTRASDGKETGSQSLSVRVPEPWVALTVRRLTELQAGSPHPLFTRHLQALESMAREEWTRTGRFIGPDNPEAAKTLGYITALGLGIQNQGPATRWESYYRDGMPLILAFRSSDDGTAQYYSLVLPKGWSPELTRVTQKTYPLFVELHGGWDPNPLAQPAAYYFGTRLDGAGYQGPTTFEMRDRAGYHILPFNRSSFGSWNHAEAYFWQALEDFKASFVTDPDRAYLYGFSAGAGGAFRIGRETPDRWAAVGILSGLRATAPWEAQNISSVPVYVWAGEDDRVVYEDKSRPGPILKEFARQVTEAGGIVKALVAPGIGHEYRAEVQEDEIQWMKTFTRHRPDRFQFTVTDDRYPGVWGISLRRPPTKGAVAWFECRIQGNQVAVDTKGASEVDIIFGKGGLGLAGDVTLTVDGKRLYTGPATDKAVTSSH